MTPHISCAEAQTAVRGRWIRNAAPKDKVISSITSDSRRPCPGALFLALPGEKFDGHAFLADAIKQGAEVLCVVEEKLPKDLNIPENVSVLAVNETVAAYQSLANFHRHRFPSLPVAAVTGSSGKTSTKEMLRAIFAAAYGAEAVCATEGNTNNHVGVPQNLLRLTPEHKACIIEMGSNHHGEIAPLSRCAEPDAALITCIGRCHLEHFGDLDGVAREKSSIFSFLKPGGTAVIPKDCPQRKILEDAAKGKKILYFGNTPDCDVQSIYSGGHLHGSSFELHWKNGPSHKISWRLTGAHQALNAAGAACAAGALGVSPEKIAAGLAECSLPGMRMRVSEKGGITWINDAYNANPDSMAACLAWLSEFAHPEKLILVLGDMLEIGSTAAQSHTETLQKAAKLIPGARIVAVGPMMLAAADSLSGLTAAKCGSSAEAAPLVQALARPGDMVFLKASRGTKLEVVEPAQ
ncbi:MAG: hypothetical protein A2X49_15020 [Lentisphaerae bacterium GWF2_52_8]|nr:MAG: hypothetical protein A2X49_15020 [Lentisphaerae bacterium GWF2_52_8]